MSISELNACLEQRVGYHRDDDIATAKDIHAHLETDNKQYYANQPEHD